LSVRIFFLDTNILLRITLKDNVLQAQESQRYFEQARQGDCTLVLIPAIVLEFEYVLRKVYRIPPEKRREYLVNLVETPYLEVRDRNLLKQALRLYGHTPFDLVDLFVFASAQHENAEVLSFDKDFRKLAVAQDPAK